MSSRLPGLALALALVGVGVGVHAATRDAPGTSDLDLRLGALEDQVTRLQATLGAQRAAEVERQPTLLGLDLEPAPARTSDGHGVRQAVADGAAPAAAEGAAAVGTSEEIQELVERAVERKAAEWQVMREKKPTLDVFAKTLELSDAQRDQVARDVARAQHAIQGILEIPAEDGTHFLEELVELMADGLARPGQQGGRGARLFGRLLSERIPGSDETYAARVEVVKNALRASFQRQWSEKQYATFQAWQMDPTEVKDIEGSPFKQLEARVLERAKQLGAELPAREGR